MPHDQHPHAAAPAHAANADASQAGIPHTERYAISGIAQWQQTLEKLLRTAEQQACPRIVCCSPDFSGWPLSSAPLLDALQDWLRPQRQLILIANQFDTLIRQQPRFVAWRTRWDTVVQGRKVARQFTRETPSFALAGRQSIWLSNPDFFTGIYGNDPALAQQVGEQAQEWLENRSSIGFASRTLGL
ncbi:hypothetical protein EBQ34_05435 [Vandammella animalimorsus]|uniref:Uncharacterized protein n=1 Tax=Vandammella animalimorsus TaxID=2029117 RepID=A0A3M6RKT6_9BURK|nr:hypothetical protein [Vandammella animalimorsus]RMX16010.1 hypothetical protein EBQ34_05435 [Vandammella animalimorsus]